MRLYRYSILAVLSLGFLVVTMPAALATEVWERYDWAWDWDYSADVEGSVSVQDSLYVTKLTPLTSFPHRTRVDVRGVSRSYYYDHMALWGGGSKVSLLRHWNRVHCITHNLRSMRTGESGWHITQTPTGGVATWSRIIVGDFFSEFGSIVNRYNTDYGIRCVMETLPTAVSNCAQAVIEMDGYDHMILDADYIDNLFTYSPSW